VKIRLKQAHHNQDKRRQTINNMQEPLGLPAVFAFLVGEDHGSGFIARAIVMKSKSGIRSIRNVLCQGA